MRSVSCEGQGGRLYFPVLSSWHKLCPFVIVGLLATATGCRSTDSEASFFHTGGWEDAKEAKSYLDRYKHVLVACVYEDHWEGRGPGRLAPHHFKATVVRTYKGDWSFSERVAFVHYVDARALSISNAHAGSLVFVFTNDHTDAEIALDTGDFGACDRELERALQLVYSPRDNR